MLIEIWSDVVCPWCYVGKRHIEVALDSFGHADEVEVVWRSFELDPTAPPERKGSYDERLSTKYGVSIAEARAMTERMARTGAGVGLTLDFDRARPGNTFDAHRLLHLAHDRGLQGALKERLFAATFTEGLPIGEHDTLAGLAAEVGLDPAEVAEVLAGDRYADDVRADERQAEEHGISGVPYFVVDRRFAASGAQPPDVLLRVLQRAWDKAHPEPALVSVVDPADGCDDEGCAV